MLDTNIISYLIKSRDVKLIDTFESISKEHRIGVSVITTAELFYGVKKKGSLKLEVRVREFLSPLEKFSFDEDSAYCYADIRNSLESTGDIIGAHDMLIAAHAKSIDAVLVTNNIKEFVKVPDLKVENWV
jgi:tRNA(fMet)-specific endonuclease VapC